jgi:RNA polymerase sigma factor (sigma-70 family)
MDLPEASPTSTASTDADLRDLWYVLTHRPQRVREYSYEVGLREGLEHHDADEVASEVLVRLLARGDEGRLRWVDHPKAYIATATRNRIRDFVRSEERRRGRQTVLLPDSDWTEDELPIEDFDDRAAVISAAAIVCTDEQRVVIESILLLGRSVAEIADNLGITVRAVEMRRAAAVERIQTHFALDGDA